MGRNHYDRLPDLTNELAMLLCAKRKQMKKNHPVRYWLDAANDPSEISLDENVTRTWRR
jgi:hypothetical protein